jgi:hypothetical protein
MLGKLPVDDHRELFRTRLADLINPQHELALLANTIDWNYFENEFKGFYSDKPSRPAMPIRLMVGVLMLKHLYNLGDERIPEHWVRDVSPRYALGSTIDFRAVAGHELIHAYHYYMLPNTVSLYTERVAHQYTYSVYMNSNRIASAMLQLNTMINNSFFGSYPAQYSVPLIFRFSF